MEREVWNRCGICGRFFSYLDIERGKITSDFTPDSAYTYEKTEFFHKKCEEGLKV